MSKDKYNKKDLARFKKEIQKRIDELNGNMDGIRDDLNIDSKGNASLAQDSVSVSYTHLTLPTKRIV